MPEHDASEEHPDLPLDASDEPEFADQNTEVTTTPQTPERLAEVSPEPVQPPTGDLGAYAPYDPVLARQGTQVEGLFDADGNRLPEFDPKYRDEFQGLLYLGALTKRFTWLGHAFVIRTLSVDELLAVTLLTKEYDETMGQGLAYRIAMAACTLVTIDGKELPIPVGVEVDPYAWARMRFDAVKGYYQFTIEAIYAEYFDLEQTVVKVVEAMGKALAPSAVTPG